MIPSVVASELRNCISDYLRTTFRPTTPGFDSLMERFIEVPENVGRGPYVSLGLPFRSGTTDNGYFRHIPMQFAPHLHQERAFVRLSPPYYQSTLIATGTGSGKTECFLLPLLEHCRLNIGEPGIKAILIYPMNALATDQSKRIAELIYSTPALQGKVTAGLYVGDSDETPTTMMTAEKVITDKRIIRDSPPDILITNYKMLDYLLIQPDSQKLWRYNQPETLRYIVVDEFHTFDGAQGTDLACLLRRLKHRLNTPPRFLACVGTSATLGGKDSRSDMLSYAATIFQETLDEGALIEEDRQTAAEFLQEALLNVLPVPDPDSIAQLQPESFSTPEAYLRTQAQLWLLDNAPKAEPPSLSLGVSNAQQTLDIASTTQLALHEPNPDAPLTNEWRVQLGLELKTLPIIQILVRMLGNRPHSYDDLFENLRRRLHFPKSDRPEYLPLLLDSLFALVATAKRQLTRPDGKAIYLPWVTLRVQIWLKELRRMVATVEPLPQLRFSSDLTPEESKKTLPVIHCRDCGATGWAGVRPNQSTQKLTPNDLKRFYQEFFSRKPLVSFLFPADTNSSDSLKLCPECFTINGPGVKTCQSCGHLELIHVHVPSFTRTETHEGQKSTVSHNDCPFCGSSNGLSILGAQAASLTSAMIGVLYTTPFNRDKKLLTFSDSVQDAAHRAGFFGARTYRTTLRTAIAHTVRSADAKGLTLQALIDTFPTHWQQRLGLSAEYVATFLPTDLEWLREWGDFVRSAQTELDPDSKLPALLNERLAWEIVNQFGHRSALGPTLERSGTCTANFEAAPLKQAIADLHFKLSNEVASLRSVEPERVRQFILGLLHHLRQRGGILQSATQIYISEGGNTFLLQKPLFMPNMGPRIPAPIFLVNASAKCDRFEQVIQPGQKSSWCEDWTARILGSSELLLKDQVIEVLHTALEALETVGLIESKACGNGKVWGIPMSSIWIQSGGTVLACDRCSHQLTASPAEEASLEGMTCLNQGCTGHYRPDPRIGLAYYRQLYGSGDVRRIIASEHTGLLTRENRERLEQRFIDGDRRCDPNLLSATSTLEMGINIGDLSSVLLCSVPPGPANFQQRIGRAGRKDGNSFVGTIATGRPHDLYFYADPMQMLMGSVDAAGCYLDASAILERQLTAFCLDNWVKTDVSNSDFPPKLNDVLNGIERNDMSRFPYNWLQFIQEHQAELLESFLKLFEDAIEERTQNQLRTFMEQGEQDEGGLRWRILDRLDGVRQDRTRLSSQIKNISGKIKKLKEEPAALQDPERLGELEREKASFRQLIRDVNDKHILNFLTDEGLLPNYAFPESGVTLRSILWRKRDKSENSNGSSYETFTLTYERPGALAIRELVPSGVFYAEGRRVKIDQIDLKLSEPEDWRMCRSCSYTIQTIHSAANAPTCPRCGDLMWRDQGRVRRMLRLRQVMATTSDKKSRFGDDREDRSTGFFQRHLLVDFEPENREKTFLVQDKDFPFGFEYIGRTNFRELNLGESVSTGETVELSGQRYTTRGFRVCKSCGKVMKGNEPKDHAINCQWRDKPDQAKAEEVLYLYREFSSEAIRLLMPDESFWTEQGLNSFVAALQLGLKQVFRGKVDHLKVTICDEPQPNSSLRKSYLYLYDTVPGGTGYLRQLIRNPDGFLNIFRSALLVLRACDCEDGCYKCLLAFRNGSDQDETSRNTAVKLLAQLVKYWPQLKETSDGLSAIRLNSNFDSELERRFIEAIRRYSGDVSQGSKPILQKDIVNGKAGYYLKLGEATWFIETQVNLNSNNGVQIPSRADFLFRPASSRSSSRPIAVFTDGWEFHQDRISEDYKQRLSILRSGQFWGWSLSWDDVEKQINPDSTISRSEGLQCQPNKKFHEESQTVYEQYGCAEMRDLERRSSFEWLMSYLAKPDHNQWQNWALLRTFAQADAKSFQNVALQTQWQKKVTQLLDEEVIDLWDPSSKCMSAEVQVSPELKILSSLDVNRHRKLEDIGSLVVLNLDDQKSSGSTSLKGSWIESLRLFNLYQFLPHFYAVTASMVAKGYSPDFPRLSTVASSGEASYQSAQWDELRQLLAEDSLLPAIAQMEREDWPIPEAGYELVGDRGAVVATAELAWQGAKVAVTLNDEDRNGFRTEGWTAFNCTEFLSSLDTLAQQLKGASL